MAVYVDGRSLTVDCSFTPDIVLNRVPFPFEDNLTEIRSHGLQTQSRCSALPSPPAPSAKPCMTDSLHLTRPFHLGVWPCLSRRSGQSTHAVCAPMTQNHIPRRFFSPLLPNFCLFSPTKSGLLAQAPASKRVYPSDHSRLLCHSVFFLRVPPLRKRRLWRQETYAL